MVGDWGDRRLSPQRTRRIAEKRRGNFLRAAGAQQISLRTSAALSVLCGEGLFRSYPPDPRPSHRSPFRFPLPTLTRRNPPNEAHGQAAERERPSRQGDVSVTSARCAVLAAAAVLLASAAVPAAAQISDGVVR